MFEIILHPTRPEYRQSGTLGDDRKHWFRAKFGGGRFRLFFGYSTSAKVIVFAWVNDETTLRTYGSKSDVYGEFRKMPDKGNPPDNWAALLAAAGEPEARERLGAASRDTRHEPLSALGPAGPFAAARPVGRSRRPARLSARAAAASRAPHARCQG